MMRAVSKTIRKEERGMALLLTLFALLLLSAIGLFMVLSSNTETRIDANYGSSLRAYYAARSGLEEVRDRLKYTAANTPAGMAPGLADLLPQNIAGNAGGVLYVLNPAGGETVDPTDLTSSYFDDELCHAYNSGTPKGIRCASVPTIQNWQLPAQLSLLTSSPTTGQAGLKWVRINMKTNRIADPYFVDQTGSSSTLDSPVCWDGQTEQLSPGGSCDANGMQTVYMLTALATINGASGPNGAKKLLQVEVTAPSIRPAGALTTTSLAMPSNTGIPALAVDGRVHTLYGGLATNPDGSVATVKGCSPIAAVATDSGSAGIAQALNQLRANIVNAANAACSSSGGSSSACTPGLAWVYGSGSTPRFYTSSSGSNTSGSNTSGSDGGSSGGSGHDDGSKSNTSTSVSYTNLDLSAPQLYGQAASSTASFAPFTGKPGNQSDGTIYQPGVTQTVGDEIAAIRNLVAISQGQPNYFTVTSATIGSSYGSASGTPGPAVVVDASSDSSLTIPAGTTLTGYGVLVVPNALEIYGTLNWTGIVLVNSGAGHVTVGANASGFINGALLLAPGATFNFPSGSASSPNFMINYSCDAIDLPFNVLPFKVISTAENSN
jgi:hypothetical protein